MSQSQRIVLITATLFLLCSEIVPPWQYQYNYLNFTSTCPAGYDFVTQPPPLPSDSKTQMRCFGSDPVTDIKVRRDVGRSNLQRMILGSIALGLFLQLGDRKTRKMRVFSAIVLAVGVLLLLGYVMLLYFTY